MASYLRSLRNLRRRAILSKAIRHVSQVLIEKLESKTFLSVSVNSQGFTVVTPSAVSRIIYVSSSTGSDTNSGLSASTPVASIARGYSLLRNGEPDELLFMRGDTFAGSFTYFGDSGLSASEPMVVSYYGDPSLPRPVIDAGDTSAFRTGTTNNYVDIIGLSFTSSTHNPGSPNYNGTGSYGFYDLGGSNDLLIQDCQFSYFINDITFQNYSSAISNITINGNEILDSYSTVGHSEGMYADGVTGLTITNNVFDHDGWNASVSGAGATIFNHDCYISSSCAGCVITNNVFADDGSFGLEARAGGVVDDNLFVGDPYGFSFGLVNGSTTKAGGVTGQVIGNVVIDPRVDTVNGWGVGAMFGNIAPGGNTVISNNIFADEPGGSAPAMDFTPGIGVSNVAQEVGLNSVTISNNTVYDWGFGVLMSSSYVAGGTGADALNNVVFKDNNFQDNVVGRIVSHGNAVNSADETWLDNTYSSSTSISQWFSLQGPLISFSTWQAEVEPTAIDATVAFNDPTETISTYMTSIGLTGGLTSFIAGARAESETAWNPVYLASAVVTYIQEGFTIGAQTTGGTSGSAGSPTTPTGFYAVTGKSSITLNWLDPADNETGFTLERATNSTFTAGVSTTTLSASATTYADTTAVAGTTYYYELFATNSAGSSAATPAVSAEVPVVTTQTPVAPKLTSVTENYSSTATAAVTSISLVFSEAVTLKSSMVTLSSSNGTTPVTVSNPSGDGKTWVVTWTSSLTDDSLPTGSYTLTLAGNSILNSAGASVGGGNLTTDFTSTQPTTPTTGGNGSGGFQSGFGGHRGHGGHGHGGR